MYDRLIQRGVNFVFTHGDASEEKREIYQYGIELIIMSLVNTSILLILGLIIGRLFETFLLLLAFAFMQSFAGGYHAMTHLRCFLFMFAAWASSMLILPFIEAHRFLPCILAVVGTFVVYLLAPVKHVNYPMSQEKENRMKKIARFIATLFCVVVFICSIFFYQQTVIDAVWGLTLFLSAISILCAVAKESLHKKYNN